MSELRIVPTYFGNNRSQFNVLLHTVEGKTTEYFIPKEFGDAMECTNARRIVGKHCPNSKTLGELRGAYQNCTLPGIYNHPDTLLVEEDELYEFLFACNKPKAKIFRKWVCREVLPQIRVRGFFAMPGAIFPQPHQQAIGYQRQPHELEYADCVREGNEGTPESKLGRIKEKMT